MAGGTRRGLKKVIEAEEMYDADWHLTGEHAESYWIGDQEAESEELSAIPEEEAQAQWVLAQNTPFMASKQARQEQMKGRGWTAPTPFAKGKSKGKRKGKPYSTNW
eukprot:3367756-Amphidinium_carterae.1